jgi:hypothetical protein
MFWYEQASNMLLGDILRAPRQVVLERVAAGAISRRDPPAAQWRRRKRQPAARVFDVWLFDAFCGH